MKIVKLWKSIAGSAVLTLSLMHTPAMADVNFEGDPTVPIQAQSILRGGFTFSSSNVGIRNDASGLGPSAVNGTNMLVFSDDSLLTITRADHAHFSLSYFDVGGWAQIPVGSPGPLVVTGYSGAPTPLSLSIAFPRGSFVEGGVTTSLFTNLESLTMRIDGYPNKTVYVAIDNLVLTPVPEPETYALLLAGLGLLTVIGRRRKTLG